MKSLNVEEKSLLRRFGLDPRTFLRLEKTFENFTFIQITTNKILCLRR